ncbi:MAG: hypothetical protein U5L00_07285 [Desulfovermiculus sp.]|nr:hypothetical protein [Desulfovermiculus sp.]
MAINKYRSERDLQGKIIDKYRLQNNNLGLTVEDEYGKRYSVEFQTNSVRPRFTNLFGLYEPYRGCDQSLDKLIEPDSSIGLRINQGQSPLRTAYQLNYVSKPLSPNFQYTGSSRMTDYRSLYLQ